MKKFQDSKILYNPFRMYRYEIVGAYVDYIFTDEDVETRQSMDDDGYDDVTELERFRNFSSEIKQRYLPFLWEITENDFIQDFNKLSYDDVKATQDWAKNPSDKIKLFTKLRYQEERLHKIDTESFLKSTINKDYEKDNGSDLTLDDLKSFDMSLTFYYHRKFDSVFVSIKDPEFNITVRLRKNPTPYDSGFYVPSDTFEYYFGIDRYNYKRKMVSTLLQKELTLTPVMFLSSDLYLNIKDKIRCLCYEASMEE